MCQCPQQTREGGRTQGTRAVPWLRLETRSHLGFCVCHVEAADDRLCEKRQQQKPLSTSHPALIMADIKHDWNETGIAINS